jgi:hypothetical protein
MNAVTLKAHYDGKNICPDEPLDLRAGSELMVTIVPAAAADQEREELYEMSRQSLARAYGDTEPDYSRYLGRPAPPE